MSRTFRFSPHWLWLLLALPVVLGLWRLRFDVEVLNLLPARSPAVHGLKLYQENFASARQLIITVRASEAEPAEAAAHAIAVALRRATNLVARADWQPPWLEYPGQSAELVAFLWLNQPPEIFAELTRRLTDSAIAASLTEAREQLATGLSPASFALGGYDPFNLTRLPEAVAAGASTPGAGQELFAGADGTFRVVFVEAARDLAGYRACLTWLKEVKSVVKAARGSSAPSRSPQEEAQPSSLEIRYTGRPAFVAEIAGGMERDMFGSVGGTLAIIAALFGLVHRRALPLLWIVGLLVLILGATMALGGLIYGPIHVVSMGFAAILLGLSVDYGLVLYQEAQATPQASARELRRNAGAGILWSAVTTAGAFLMLNLSSLPGLAQLGTLVAVGVTLAAVVMLFAYLPPLRRTAGSEGHDVLETRPPDPGHRLPLSTEGGMPAATSLVWLVTFLVPVVTAILLFRSGLDFDHSTDALRPKNSPAYAALDEIKAQIARSAEPLWLLVPGHDESEVARRLGALELALRGATNGHAANFTLPVALWPNPAHQSANRSALVSLEGRAPALRDAALGAGFTSNSLALTENLFATWRGASSSTNTFWPTNDSSRWVLDKLAAQPVRGTALPPPVRWKAPARPAFVALGLISPASNSPETVTALSREFARSGALLSGWPALGIEVFDVVRRDLPRVLGPMLALLLGSLWLAFRRPGDVVISLASLLFAGLLLHLTMSLAGWSWNLMNLMALPLLLGAGVDYSIHMQLALHRHSGDARAVRRTVGRALFLCAATTVAGFGSLAWSSNAGMASLGRVCAAGVTAAYLTAVFVLPVWWIAFAKARGSRLKPQGKFQ